VLANLTGAIKDECAARGGDHPSTTGSDCQDFGYLSQRVVDGVVCAFQAHTDISTVTSLRSAFRRPSVRPGPRSWHACCASRRRYLAARRGCCTLAAKE
jgi:hypothetical protein